VSISLDGRRAAVPNLEIQSVMLTSLGLTNARAGLRVSHGSLCILRGAFAARSISWLGWITLKSAVARIDRRVAALFSLSTLLLVAGFTSPADCQPALSASTVSISGRVVNDRNEPINGVEVQAQGLRTVRTGRKGNFTLAGPAPSTDRLVVNFSAPSYMANTRVYTAHRISARMRRSIGGPAVTWGRIAGEGNTVIIWPRASAVTIDAERGGKIAFPNGGGVTLPERALVDSNGRAVKGKVQVRLTYLDVTDRKQLAAAPGDFTARMRDGSISRLESFGIFEIMASDLQGNPVNLLRGSSAKLELPVPRTRRGRPPDRTGLYSFDNGTGRWNDVGTLTIVGTAVYVGTLTALNVPWNSDITDETTCMTVKVVNPFKNPPNQPEPNAWVNATGVSYSSSTSGSTDANGIDCLLVKRCAPVMLQAFSSQYVYWVSVPVTVTSSCVAAGPSDCGDLTKCPLITVTLDLIVSSTPAPPP
jgi:Carboxypeptidase regulatory-like domain